jgi:hypothetical protein
VSSAPPPTFTTVGPLEQGSPGSVPASFQTGTGAPGAETIPDSFKLTAEGTSDTPPDSFRMDGEAKSAASAQIREAKGGKIHMVLEFDR